MKPATRKVSVVGAGGVGAAIGFAALIKGVALDVALHDLDFAKAEASCPPSASRRPTLPSSSSATRSMY